MSASLTWMLRHLMIINFTVVFVFLSRCLHDHSQLISLLKVVNMKPALRDHAGAKPSHIQLCYITKPWADKTSEHHDEVASVSTFLSRVLLVVFFHFCVWLSELNDVGKIMKHFTTRSSFLKYQNAGSKNTETPFQCQVSYTAVPH